MFTLLLTVVTMGFAWFGGWYGFLAYAATNSDERRNHIVRASILGAIGLLIMITNLVAINSQGKTGVDVPESGAFEKNKAMEPEKTRSELKTEYEEKMAEEKGEEYNKSLEEIRAESNQYLENAVKEK
jgi:hypothetical protein